MKRYLLEAKRILNEESEYLVPSNAAVFKGIINIYQNHLKIRELPKLSPLT